MSIIVEDGSGKSDAQAYCSAAFADAWHLARGITVWATLSTNEKEQALVRAANYMVQTYRLRWRGWRGSATQLLDWPRVGVEVVDSPYENGLVAANVVPIEVQQANAELALKAAAGDLLADIDRSSAVKREKVDVIEVEYRDNAPTTTRYQSVENMLAPYLAAITTGSGAGHMKLVRA